MTKPQIIFIHGGNTFDSREQYYAYLQKREFELTEDNSHWMQPIREALTDSEFFMPSMPASDDADYLAWKIWFEKLFPFLHGGKIILIGHSLGTIFLAKYLSENAFPKPVHAIHLVGSVFDGEGIIDEGMANFILDPAKVSDIEKVTTNIYLYHSVDDPVCPWRNVEKYQKYLPHAQLHRFTDRWHFLDATFPELLEQLKKEII